MRPTSTCAPSLLAACLFLLPPLAPMAVAATGAVPELVHAEIYRSAIDPADYWVSEKLDGVRAVWDGEHLRFRSGRVIAAPAWFTRGFPARPLDGELWIGRGQFDRLSGIVRKELAVDTEWQAVRYLLFELPGRAGDFSARIDDMRAIVAAAALPHLQMVEQFRVADRAELLRRFDSVLKQGGEGLMLHRTAAPYRAGRSDDLLKLKPWEDAEAVVIAHLPGKGKFSGKLGALRVALPDGRQFSIGGGFNDAQRAAPPPIGSTITFRFRGRTAGGLPRFASFLRVRETF